jgi:Na+-transporting NADH:ubiquinone oxidoreductase subunit NqrC
LSISPTKEWTQITRRKEVNILYQGRKAQRAILPVPPPSKEDGKKNTTIPAPFYPNVLFIQGRLESLPIFNDEPTIQGRNYPNMMPGDGETDAGMCGDITKPENGTWRNPYLGAKLWKWEKLLMNECTEKDATPAVAIVDGLKNGNRN